MPFIGILTNKKQEKEYESILKNIIKNRSIICINDKNITNIKNVKFETIIIDKKTIINKDDILKDILNNAKFLLVNSDEKIKFNANIDTVIINYGFNSKSTITVSSIQKESTLLCVQRKIKNVNNKLIEEQEVNINNNSINKYINIGIGSINILYMDEKI